MRQALEIAAWSLPLIVAVRYARGAPAGARNAWWLLAAGCAVIVLDKSFDFQMPLYQAGKNLVHTLDPELRLRGEHLWIRYVLLSGFFLIGCIGLFFFLRRDRDLSLAKGVSHLGLAMVMAYLGLRLVPRISDRLTESLHFAAQTLCYSVLLGGLWMGREGRD